MKLAATRVKVPPVELLARLERWLAAHDLTLNETKTRTLEVRAGRSGRHDPQVEPHPQSQRKLRDKLREELSPGTLWQPAAEVIPEVKWLRQDWGGYFHYANRTRVLDRTNR